jgi:hypothetical protein
MDLGRENFNRPFIVSIKNTVSFAIFSLFGTAGVCAAEAEAGLVRCGHDERDALV